MNFHILHKTIFLRWSLLKKSLKAGICCGGDKYDRIVSFLLLQHVWVKKVDVRFDFLVSHPRYSVFGNATVQIEPAFVQTCLDFDKSWCGVPYQTCQVSNHRIQHRSVPMESVRLTWAPHTQSPGWSTLIKWLYNLPLHLTADSQTTPVKLISNIGVVLISKIRLAIVKLLVDSSEDHTCKILAF